MLHALARLGFCQSITMINVVCKTTWQGVPAGGFYFGGNA